MILFSVITIDCKFSWSLLGLENYQLITETWNIYTFFEGLVHSRNTRFIYFTGDKERSHIFKVNFLDIVECIFDLFVNVIKDLKRLRKASRLMSFLKPNEPIIPIPNFLPKFLMERYLAIRFLSIHHILTQLFERKYHLWYIFGLIVIRPCRFYCIVPIFLQFYSSPHQLTRYLLHLLHQLTMS